MCNSAIKFVCFFCGVQSVVGFVGHQVAWPSFVKLFKVRVSTENLKLINLIYHRFRDLTFLPFCSILCRFKNIFLFLAM